MIRAIATGVAHFGPGAFHRPHQATYFDTLSADDPRWGIAAVSLRSPGTVAALAEQDGLYTVAVLDRDPSMRLIGSHRDWIGPGGGPQVASLLADPKVRIVTSTVTEKGYCLAGARPAGSIRSPYTEAVLTRFRNPRSDICCRRSPGTGRKSCPIARSIPSPQRSAGRPVERLAIPVVAWMVFIARRSDSGEAITDPLAGPLADAARGATPHSWSNACSPSTRSSAPNSRKTALFGAPSPARRTGSLPAKSRICSKSNRCLAIDTGFH